MTPERGSLDQFLEVHAPEFGYPAHHSPEFAFTTKQRQALTQRDGGKCQFPVPHLCDEEHPLEVHHILPQGLCKKVGVDPDYPEYALTICRNAHDTIHPDRVPSRKEYYQNRQAFQDLQDRRISMTGQHIPYWNTTYDRAMLIVAAKNTQRARQEGWKFPPKGKDKDQEELTKIE